jgi:hypothetical protein
MKRIITRHANRKLYDPSGKRYVALADIVDLVVAGDSIKVVEHPSGEDATARILAQTLVDLVKRRAQSLPEGLMETLVRLAGGGKPVPREAAAPVRDLAARARREAEAIAARLVARGRLGIEEALHLRKEVEDAIHDGVQAAEAATRIRIDALRPGRAVTTITGLARELKALESIVTRPASPAPRRPRPASRRASGASSSSTKPRS